MLTPYTRKGVEMGSRARTSGVWMDEETDVLRRHDERVARSLAAFGARGAPRRRRRWAVLVGRLGSRSGSPCSRRVALLR